MKLYWLQCEVFPGQFSNEFTIRGTDKSGNLFSLFVSAENLDSDQEQLKVMAIQESSESVLIELPTETLENGNTVTVHRDMLSPVESQEYA